MKYHKGMIAKIAVVVFVTSGLTFITAMPQAHAAGTVVACPGGGQYLVGETTTGQVSQGTTCVGALSFGPSVTSIGANAFLNNRNLTDVVISETITSIGNSAFKGTEMTSLTFREGLTSISNQAFQSVNNVSHRYLDVALPNSLTSASGPIFSSGYWGNVSIGTGLTTVWNNLFGDITGIHGIKSVTFRSPTTVTAVQANSFSGYQGDEIVLPTGLLNYGEMVNGGNIADSAANLQYLWIPSGVSNLWDGVLSGNNSLHTLILPDTLTISAGAFTGTGANSLANVIYCGNNSDVLNASYPNGLHPFCGKAVIYMANGGSGNMSTLTSSTASAKNLSSNSFTKSGYEFDGWNTKKDGTGISYAAGQSYAFSANIVLYAKWRTCSSCEDNSVEARKKRQAAIDAARLALVSKIKAGNVIVNPDLTDADLPTFNTDLAKRANADFAVAAKAKDFGFNAVRAIVTKYSIYQDIENGVRSNVSGRIAFAAGIVPASVKQKQTLINQVMSALPADRSTVEAIDKLIAELAKAQEARQARKDAIINKIATRK